MRSYLELDGRGFAMPYGSREVRGPCELVHGPVVIRSIMSWEPQSDLLVGNMPMTRGPRITRLPFVPALHLERGDVAYWHPRSGRLAHYGLRDAARVRELIVIYRRDAAGTWRPEADLQNTAAHTGGRVMRFAVP